MPIFDTVIGNVFIITIVLLLFVELWVTIHSND